MRRLLEEELRELDFDVESVGSAEEALALLAHRPAELLLVDWTLPGMSGLELTRLIRARPDGDVPVILVVTGRREPDDLGAVLDAGASDYLAKPVDPEQLQRRLLIARRHAERTQRARADRRALEEAERAFEQLVDAAPDAILVHRRGEVVYANRALLRFLDRATESVVGARLASLVLPDDHGLLGELPLEDDATLRLLHRDGTVRTIEVAAVAMRFRGEPSVALLMRDLTQRRATQSRLMAADRLASVGTLAAAIAHELNNPLAYVLSNIGLSREELERAPTDARLRLVRAQLDEAAEGGRRMRDILRDLRTFTVREEDVEGPRAADLQGVLRSSIHLCWNAIRHQGTLERRFGEVPPVDITESRMGQVFLNLLMNAAEALEGGGEIEVRTETDAEGWALVTVRDTGKGIAPEDMAQIFEPFFSRKAEGTGLGLAICHDIVLAAGGELAAESTPGRGSTFTVRLPPAERRPARPAVEVAPPRREEKSKARVLVIDDEELVGRSLARALMKHEVEVLQAGAAAIERLTGTAAPELDIILCDVMMPGTSGIDVYRAVLAHDPALAKRFVFMTGGAFGSQARRFLDASERPVLDKPFDLGQVRELVEEYARR